MHFDDAAFFSIWYWLLTAVVWALATHFTHGIPHDLLRRAVAKGGDDAEIFDVLARRALGRISAGVTRWGAVGAAAGCFAATALAMAGFGAGSELALGLFLILAPLGLMQALSLAEAVRLARRGTSDPGTLTPEALIRAHLRRRLANQLFGALSVGVAVAVLALRHREQLIFIETW